MLNVFPKEGGRCFVLLTTALALQACALGSESNDERPTVEATVFQPDGEGGATGSVWASGELTRVGNDYVLDDMLFPEWLVEELRDDSGSSIGASEQALGAFTDARYLWPGGVVPYVIDASLPAKDRVTQAINHWAARTPIRLVPRTNEANYVRFESVAKGCSAHVGKVGGEQKVSLEPACDWSAVVHEIGHAVGMWHEHMRTDRDQHVRVYYENIDAQYHSAFDIVQAATPIGPYDTDSVMHYYSYAFSKNGKATILTRSGAEISTKPNGLSALDAEYVTILYDGYDGTFADDDGNTHEAAIEKIATAGITVGCSQGYPRLYCPGRTVTRAEMAVFLKRAIGLPDSGVNHFSDDDGAWYEGAANSIADAGVTVGCSPTQYCGDRNVSRAEMAVFLTRALSLPEASSDYFSDDDGAWYEDAANRMYEAGVTKGCGARSYCGDDPVLRDQMASFLARAFL